MTMTMLMISEHLSWATCLTWLIILLNPHIIPERWVFLQIKKLDFETLISPRHMASKWSNQDLIQVSLLFALIIAITGSENNNEAKWQI